MEQEVWVGIFRKLLHDLVSNHQEKAFCVMVAKKLSSHGINVVIFDVGDLDISKDNKLVIVDGDIYPKSKETFVKKEGIEPDLVYIRLSTPVQGGMSENEAYKANVKLNLGKWKDRHKDNITEFVDRFSRFVNYEEGKGRTMEGAIADYFEKKRRVLIIPPNYALATTSKKDIIYNLLHIGSPTEVYAPYVAYVGADNFDAELKKIEGKVLEKTTNPKYFFVLTIKYFNGKRSL